MTSVHIHIQAQEQEPHLLYRWSLVLNCSNESGATRRGPAQELAGIWGRNKAGYRPGSTWRNRLALFSFFLKGPHGGAPSAIPAPCGVGGRTRRLKYGISPKTRFWIVRDFHGTKTLFYHAGNRSFLGEILDENFDF